MVEVLEHGLWSWNTGSYDNPHRTDDFCVLCQGECFSGVGVPEREHARARCLQGLGVARERGSLRLNRTRLTRLRCLTRLRPDLHLYSRRHRCRNSAG